MYNLILSKTNRLVVLHLIKCPSDRIVEWSLHEITWFLKSINYTLET
jgi:hypothetical protein